jgi:hypothetical protein
VKATGEKAVSTLLIYIPCHVDYKLALDNVERLSKQFKGLPSNEVTFQIRIVVSINGVAEVEELATMKNIEVVRFGENIGGDSNISLGFMKALELDIDYFWLLSANETLQPNALANLFDLLNKNSKTDIFVANSANRSGILKLKDVFMNHPSNLGLGLISSVIYRIENTKNYFSSSMKFGWTGWGQLAVIQEYLNHSDSPRLFEFEDNSVYEKPSTYLESSDLSEREVVRNAYRHSFYGLVILASNMYLNNEKELKLYLRRWLRSHWYKLNFFALKRHERNLEGNRNVKWLETLFKLTFKKYSLFMWILILAIEKIPISKLESVRGITWISRYFKKWAAR